VIIAVFPYFKRFCWGLTKCKPHANIETDEIKEGYDGDDFVVTDVDAIDNDNDNDERVTIYIAIPNK